MTHRIKAIFEQFDPSFTEMELSFIAVLLSSFGYGPYEYGTLHALGSFNAMYYRDYIEDLIRKGIMEDSPDHTKFNFTTEGWDAYLDLLKKQKDWESGKVFQNYLDRESFDIDASNKFELMKRLSEIFTLASKSIYIQEPYPLPNLILQIGGIEQSIEIKFLTSDKPRSKSILLAVNASINELIKARANTEFKISRNIHARKIIIDEKVAWQVTGSQTTDDKLIFIKRNDIDEETIDFMKDWDNANVFNT